MVHPDCDSSLFTELGSHLLLSLLNISLSLRTGPTSLGSSGAGLADKRKGERKGGESIAGAWVGLEMTRMGGACLSIELGPCRSCVFPKVSVGGLTVKY